MITARDTKLDAIRAHLAKQNRKPLPTRKILPLVRRIIFVPSAAPLPVSHPASVLSR